MTTTSTGSASSGVGTVPLDLSATVSLKELLAQAVNEHKSLEQEVRGIWDQLRKDLESLADQGITFEMCDEICTIYIFTYDGSPNRDRRSRNMVLSLSRYHDGIRFSGEGQKWCGIESIREGVVEKLATMVFFRR